MDNNQAIQILGRAGRGNGSLSEGYTYMFFPQEQDRNVRSMVNTPLRIQSQIPNHLDYILLCYLVAGIPENDLLDVYKETFIDHIDIGLYTETLNWLKKGGFIEQDGTPTPIGTKTAQFALEPKTVLHAIELKKILDRTRKRGLPHPLRIDDYERRILRKHIGSSKCSIRPISSPQCESVFQSSQVGKYLRRQRLLLG